MPKKLHRRLERRAKQKGLVGEKKAAYVYGTLNKVLKKKRKKRRRKSNG